MANLLLLPRCLTLDSGRFQAPEGLFHPQAWGLDNPGVHQMVHKAIQECSMDARKTMARSIFLAGGLTMLPGFTDRLREELAALLPPAAVPKVRDEGAQSSEQGLHCPRRCRFFLIFFSLFASRLLCPS